MKKEEFNRLWEEANKEFKEFVRTGLDLSEFTNDSGVIPSEAIPVASIKAMEYFLYNLLSKFFIDKNEES